MNKLFGLFLLALAFLAPNAAYAVNCFWVGGTGTWDGNNTGGGGAGGIKWASATGGGTTCAGGGTGGSPTAADTATFDANSGGGTVTPSITINLTSLTAGGFTSGTLAFNTNNNDVNISSFVSFSGAVTRTINMGSGTWTITGSSGSIWIMTTATGLTPTFQNATIAFAGASATRTFDGGAQTYGPFTIANNSTKGTVNILGANTFASITVGSGNNLLPATNVTQTVTGAVNITGTSSAQSGFMSSAPGGTVATVSVGAASVMDWAAIGSITKTGAGSITATNSFDLGRNTSITITAPSGGGGGGRIIGG